MQLHPPWKWNYYLYDVCSLRLGKTHTILKSHLIPQFIVYVFPILWSGTVRNCAILIRYSHLPSYNHQASMCGGFVMITAQRVEFTDWLGRLEEREINDRRAPYRVSGQWVVLESPMAFCRAEMVRQRVPEEVFNRWLETRGKIVKKREAKWVESQREGCTWHIVESWVSRAWF